MPAAAKVLASAEIEGGGLSTATARFDTVTLAVSEIEVVTKNVPCWAKAEHLLDALLTREWTVGANQTAVHALPPGFTYDPAALLRQANFRLSCRWPG